MEKIEDIELDCRGMKCPRPIIELAKAKRNASPGSIINIIADDLAFECDVKAWCQTTGNKIIDFNKEENTVKASIEICEVPLVKT